jgi:hypothetical protein
VSGLPVLFAGPTLARLERMTSVAPLLEGIELRPPVARGDVTELVRKRRPGTLLVCDGYFHLGRLAVGHAELRRALETGWAVWGVSSMGAIRAAEMAALGMSGFGEVFARFRDDPDFGDDEVTLLHEPAPPWRELSEPLVHLRAAAAALVARGELSAEAEADIIGDLSRSWFGDRNLLDFAERLVAAGLSTEVAHGLVRQFDPYRLKSRDLGALLEQRPFVGRG